MPRIGQTVTSWQELPVWELVVGYRKLLTGRHPADRTSRRAGRLRSDADKGAMRAELAGLDRDCGCGSWPSSPACWCGSTPTTQRTTRRSRTNRSRCSWRPRRSRGNELRERVEGRSITRTEHVDKDLPETHIEGTTDEQLTSCTVSSSPRTTSSPARRWSRKTSSRRARCRAASAVARDRRRQGEAQGPQAVTVTLDDQHAVGGSSRPATRQRRDVTGTIKDATDAARPGRAHVGVSAAGPQGDRCRLDDELAGEAATTSGTTSNTVLLRTVR